jgi:hypothetical protein
MNFAHVFSLKMLTALIFFAQLTPYCRIISRELDEFWTAEINHIRSRSENPDVELDDEANCATHDNVIDN